MTVKANGPSSTSSISCCSLCFSNHISHLAKIKILCSECDQPLTIIDGKLAQCACCAESTKNNGIEIQQEGTSNKKKRTAEKMSVDSLPHTTPAKLSSHRVKMDPHNVFSQLLLSANLFDKLPMQTALNLSLTSTTLSRIIRPFINDNFMFKLAKKREFQIYNPKKIFTYTLETNFPPSVKQIRLHNYYIDPIENFLSNLALTHLQFGHYFNQIIDDLLPQTLTHLILGNEFNSLVDNLPKSIVYLQFGKHFDREVDHLPEALVHLVFGHHFSHPVNNLPKNLKHLTFGDGFSHHIDKLPEKITHLTLGRAFRGPLDGLPKNLVHLDLGGFAQAFKSPLPQTITNLVLGDEFNSPIDNFLPNNLITLQLGGSFNQQIRSLPQSLQNLTFDDGFNGFNGSIEALSQTRIKTLIFGTSFDSPIDNHLPQTLTKLILGHEFDQCIDSLPRSLTYLQIGEAFNHPVKNLPSSLTHLFFSAETFIEKIDKLPPNLTHLEIGEYTDPLPQTLTHLTINSDFNNKDQLLNLTHLTINTKFDGTQLSSVSHLTLQYFNILTPPNLPPNITHLTFENFFGETFDALPSTVTHLKLTGGHFFEMDMINMIPNNIEYLELFVTGEIHVYKLPSQFLYFSQEPFEDPSDENEAFLLRFSKHPLECQPKKESER